jgi:hypothetical protein
MGRGYGSSRGTTGTTGAAGTKTAAREPSAGACARTLHLAQALRTIARTCSNVAPNPLRRRRSKRLRPQTLSGVGLVRAPRPLTRAAAPISGGRRLAPAALASLCALAFTAAPALAIAPTVSSEFTSPAAKPSEEVNLEAALNPNNGEPSTEATTCEFQYGETVAYGHEAACTNPEGNTSGTEQRAAATVTGLKPGTTYHWRVVLNNASGKIEGNPAEVTTLPVPATELPSPTGATTATFKGTLTPLNSTVPAEYFFVYNVGEEFVCTGERRTEPAESAGIGSGVANVSTAVTGLEPNQKYTVCLLSTNTLGDSEEDLTPKYFETPPAPPTIESESSSNVKTTEARLEGFVNPNNELTECKFQYGTEALLETGVTTTLCEPASFPAEYGGQVVGLNVGGLLAGTTYYYRIVAENEQSRKEGKPGEGAIEHFITAFPFVEAPEAKPANPVAATEATLHGVLNPHSERTSEPGSAEFVYRQAPTECRGENEKQAGDEQTPAGGEREAAEAKVSGLSPGTTYTFCVRVVNKAGEEQVSSPETFTTPAVPLEISGTSATEVTATSAKLDAQVDPGGAETTYHFEYDTSPYMTSAPHGQRTPESPSIGADNSLHPATAAIQGLQPGTTYHYRIVATNSQSPAGGTPGPDQTFTTETTGGEFALPDGRAYELVSPPQKDGAEVLGIGGGGVTLGGGDPTQASEDGTSVTYLATAPVGASPPGNVYSTQMLSTRGAGGWSSLDIATPHKHTVGVILSVGEEYLRFSSDLSHALLVPLYQTLQPSLAPEIHQEVAGHDEIYLRNNATNTFRALVTSEPLPQVSFEGATPDLSHVVFGGPNSFGHVRPGGPVGLDPNYPNAEGLFEWAEGQTRLVSVLPDHQPASGLALLGSSIRPEASSNDVSATRHAISDDGTRVVWSDEEGSLFTRNMVTGETTLIGAGGFQAASSDGSRVFFSNSDLFVFDVADKTQVDLGGAGTVVGANEEGTVVYETSPAVLTKTVNALGEKATEGANNLYLLREMPQGSGSWNSTFVTSGLEESPSDGHNGFDAREILQHRAARVSPGGRYLAFMSRRSLTGYDNRDAISGEPDEEVYWYDAETNRLVCASCDPTGARPVGQFETEEFPGVAIDPPGAWEGRWLAAVIPGWTEVNGDLSTGHQPRYLDDSGQLFFTSSDALVPRDVNGRDDVYEYEPAGVGSCRPPSYGQGASVVFNRTLGGCVALISAGTGNTDSLFFDASASGNDVFFTTQDGLVQNDRDGTTDMYDARVCTQTEACPSSFAVSPACTTTDSCRVAPVPQPGIFAAPATATFVGAGNVTPIPSATKKAAKKKTVKCAKGKKRSHGRCVKAKKKKPRAKRARNDRRPGR